MANFDLAYLKTGRHEGGYANNPNDQGKETIFGISRRYHPEWAGWKLVDDLKSHEGFPDVMYELPGLRALEKQFYREKFWNPLRLDDVKSQTLAEELYDTGVNMGTGRAARFLQKSLNLTNRMGTDYPDLTEDGRIGPVTLKRTNEHRRLSNVIKTINILQGSHYIRQCELMPSQEEFFNGWLERVKM